MKNRNLKTKEINILLIVGIIIIVIGNIIIFKEVYKDWDIFTLLTVLNISTSLILLLVLLLVLLLEINKNIKKWILVIVFFIDFSIFTLVMMMGYEGAILVPFTLLVLFFVFYEALRSKFGSKATEIIILATYLVVKFLMFFVVLLEIIEQGNLV